MPAILAICCFPCAWTLLPWQLGPLLAKSHWISHFEANGASDSRITVSKLANVARNRIECVYPFWPLDAAS
ncbi:MAG: hypothetical protein NVSMB62_11430 [Acidobacteriaceae bacterium]